MYNRITTKFQNFTTVFQNAAAGAGAQRQQNKYETLSSKND